MIEITEGAQEYFAKLIEQQEMDDIGLHISVLNPGTPHAACDLQFHVPGENSDEPQTTLSYDAFNLYVPKTSESWLKDATIDFDKDDTAGGQLTIKAPGIKGKRPEDDAELADKIVWILESEINPGLASHGGMALAYHAQSLTNNRDLLQ